jgi:uncharacterized protein YpuA (DUF1002 family)
VSTNLEGNFKIILENVKNALDHQRKTLSSVSDKEAEIKRQIQEVRNKLNLKLTELEKQLLKSYIKTRDEYVPGIQSDIAKLEKREPSYKQLEVKTNKQDTNPPTNNW